MTPTVGDGRAAEAGVHMEIPIRWGDMDALGHVNNTVYFRFCESARIRYFEAVGLDELKQRPTDGPGLVAAKLDFRRQMRYPGAVRVEAHVTRIGGRSFTIAYTLCEVGSGAVVAEGDSVCVWVDYAAERAMPLPPALIDRICAIERDEGLRPPLAAGGSLSRA